jgi:hypothetical protein
MRLVFQILLILFFFTEGFSQGEIDDERKILYRNENPLDLC